MSEKIEAYAAASKKGKLEPFSYESAPLSPEEVLIRVRYCGICHSDIAMIDNDWGFTNYPLVPGHEVVGTIAAIGSNVTNLREGQPVGLGWQCGSCGECEFCQRGKEHLCAKERDTIVQRHGGWASAVLADSRFAVPLPEPLNCPEGAPLMCAGNTVFGPMLHHNVRGEMEVAVVGIGGLGHLAVQFLSKMGCRVTAITSTHSKDKEARGLGAGQVIATKNTDELKKAAGRFDFILSTVSADVNWAEYVAALRPEGTLVLVGVPENDLRLPAFGLIQQEKRVSGGRASSPGDLAKMLNFAAEHDVKAVTENFPIAKINEAVDHVRSGHVRFRGVLELPAAA